MVGFNRLVSAVFALLSANAAVQLASASAGGWSGSHCPIAHADGGLWLRYRQRAEGASRPRPAPTALHDAPEPNVAGRADPVHHEHQVIDLQRLPWEEEEFRAGVTAGGPRRRPVPVLLHEPPASCSSTPSTRCPSCSASPRARVELRLVQSRCPRTSVRVYFPEGVRGI